jgi:hypothetical protein
MTVESPSAPERPAREKEAVSEAPSPAPDALVKKSPGADGEEVINRAFEAFEARDYEDSLRLFTQALSYDRRSLVGIGLSHYKLGDYGNARLRLEEAASEGMEEFTVRKFLALACYKQEDLQDSLANAKAALALKNDPDLRRLHDRLLREARTEEDFIDEETLHFRILFDGYRHGEIDRKILSTLEDAYRTIGREFDHFPDEPVTVVLYSNEEFRDVTLMPAWVKGVYDGKIRLPVKGMEKQGEPFLRKLLFHEYAHAMVHSITPDCPVWVNEGLAEYFSEGRSDNDMGQVIPLGSLERSFPLEGGRITATAYLESHAAVTYLIEKYGLYAMKEFLRDLSGGMDTEEAFSSAFYVPYGEFLAAWGRGT